MWQALFTREDSSVAMDLLLLLHLQPPFAYPFSLLDESSPHGF